MSYGGWGFGGRGPSAAEYQPRWPDFDESGVVLMTNAVKKMPEYRKWIQFYNFFYKFRKLKASLYSRGYKLIILSIISYTRLSYIGICWSI